MIETSSSAQSRRMLKPGERISVRRGDAFYTVTYMSPGYCGRGLKGCRRYVLWCKTDGGKMMPVNPDPDGAGLYTAHQKTCPDSELFRGGRPS